MPEAIPDWIARLPKAELHLHLEGTPAPERLVALVRESVGVALPLEEVERRYRYNDFVGFLLAYKWVCEQLRSPADYTFLLRDHLERLRAQNVLYAELTLSAGVVLWNKLDLDAVCLALGDAAKQARREFGIEVRWVLDAVRHLGPGHVARVADYAVRWKDAGVVAFGIGGEERGFPPELFRDTFERVREAGLRVTVHAGEVSGPESVWGAMKVLGAERIGHGLASFRDPKLVETLVRDNITLEVCPTSNRMTGALRLHTGGDDLAAHPLVGYCRGGVPVTINTDDPGLFFTDLNTEFSLAHRMGLDREEITRIARRAFEVAFCDDATRRSLLGRFDAAAETTGKT